MLATIQIRRVMNAHAERSRHTQELKVRLGACQAKFMRWEGHPRASELQDRMSIRTFKEMESLRKTICQKIDEGDLPEVHVKAWKKTKSRLRRNNFAIPRRLGEELGDDTWYELWPEENVGHWMTRLERIVANVNEIFEEFNKPTDQDFRIESGQKDQLRELEILASGLFELGNELHRRCTTEPDTSGWAIGLKPPQQNCDISRWFVPITIEIELRFWIKRDSRDNEQYRMHVQHKQRNKTEAIKETAAQISEAKDPTTTARNIPYKITRCCKHDVQKDKPLSIGDLLDSRSTFIQEYSWLLDRAALGYAISEWSLLLWGTPWLERFCCHGIFLDLSAKSEECAHHVFESKIHDDCRPGAEDHKVRNLGLAWAQLALGIPIRPAPTSDIEFEIQSGSGWKNVQREDINLEIITKTGFGPLQEAIDFCLRPESQVFNTPLNPSLLLKFIKKMHEP